MGLSKGTTNNPAGRPKGSINRSTAEIKTLISQFISGNLDQLQSNFDQLEPKDKLLFFRDLLKFVVPTKAESTNEIQFNAENIDPDKMSTEELERRIELKERFKELYPESMTPEERKAKIAELKRQIVLRDPELTFVNNKNLQNGTTERPN